MSAILAEASLLVSSGEAAGDGIWKAVEALIASGIIKERQAVSTFDAMLEQGTDEPGEDTTLFAASARMAIPDVKLSADERSQRVTRKASAWAEYVRAGIDAERAEVVDFRRAQAREMAT